MASGYDREDQGAQVWASPKYIDQILYVNKTISEVVDTILESSPAEPVIIIQSDHGPGPNGDLPWSGPPSGSDIQVREVLANLTALYIPAYCESEPYDSITPVNIFRLVFDDCLGTNFGLLEDNSFWNMDDPPIDFNSTS